MNKSLQGLYWSVKRLKWYYIVLLVCVIIGPFDALYMYIKAERRKDALRKRRESRKEKNPHNEHK